MQQTNQNQLVRSNETEWKSLTEIHEDDVTGVYVKSLITVGGFANGRGEFYNQELFNGRAILVHFVISDITPNSCRFEQAFSDDGGKTWEVNWIATDTRVK